MSFRTNVRTVSPPGSPGGETSKYDKKLADILVVATRVFADEGYDRASIRKVAARAGISVAGLYYYTSSKEELLFQIQDHAFGELIRQYRERCEELADPVDRLRLLIRNHLERFLANLSELVVCSREIDRLAGPLREKIEDKHREYFGLALDLFRELAAQDEQIVVDPRTAALAMFGSINWVHIWYRPETGPSAAQMADDLVRLYLKGVLPNKGDK